MAVTSEVILVAGVDYPKLQDDKRSTSRWQMAHMQPGDTRQQPWYWRRCALRVAADAARRRYRNNLRVTLFDFAAGTRQTWTARGGVLTTPGPQSLGRINYGNYRILDLKTKQLRPLQPELEKPKSPKDRGSRPSPPPVRYFTGASRLRTDEIPFRDYEREWKSAVDGKGSRLAETSISIIHVYDYIRAIGAARAKGAEAVLRELHFFCHAFEEGPILVNTPDLRKPLELRDPFDKDGRALKDFATANFTTEQLQDFRHAFAKDAFSFVWGCDATFFYKELVWQTRGQAGERPDEARILTFVYDFCWGDEKHFDDLLGKHGDPGKPKRLRMADVRTILRDALDDTYMQRLADASGVPCIGAVPGTGSDPDRIGKADTRLWHVPMGKTTGYPDRNDDCLHPENWTAWLRFYQRELEVRFDTTFSFGEAAFQTDLGRGFAVFNPLTAK